MAVGPSGGPWRLSAPSGGRKPTIYETCAPVYAAAARRGIDPLTVDRCELWQVGAMIGTAELSPEEQRRREDAEVFQARLDAAARGDEPSVDLEPFDPATLGRLAPTRVVPLPPEASN